MEKEDMFKIFVGIIVICLLILGFTEMVNAVHVLNNNSSSGGMPVIDNGSGVGRDYMVMTPDGWTTIYNVSPEQTGEPYIIYFTEV